MSTFFFPTLKRSTDDAIMKVIRKKMKGTVPTCWLIPVLLEDIEHWTLAIIINCDGGLTGKHNDCAIREVVE